MNATNDGFCMDTARENDRAAYFRARVSSKMIVAEHCGMSPFSSTESKHTTWSDITVQDIHDIRIIRMYRRAQYKRSASILLFLGHGLGWVSSLFVTTSQRSNKAKRRRLRPNAHEHDLQHHPQYWLALFSQRADKTPSAEGDIRSINRLPSTLQS
jgi:hypothetical protein